MAVTTDTNRFQDHNLVLSCFEAEVFVECPKCEKRATVIKKEPTSYYSERILKCPNCFYSQIGRTEYFNIRLTCHCANCAAEINVDLKKVNEMKETISVRCSICETTESYKVRNTVTKFKYPANGKPRENYFGLPLWLTQNFKGKDFWAFNYKHLDYLKQYISAGLREKNERSCWTLVEKLPTWMTSGKNRSKILKTISELEKK